MRYCQLNEWHMKDGGFAERHPHLLSADHLLPNLKSPGAQQSIMDRLHEVAAETKEILYWRMVSYVTVIPRSARSSSTSRKLRQKRWYNQTAWLIISEGKRWRW